MSHSLTHVGGNSLKQASFLRRYGYTIVTAVLFLSAFAGHWWLGWIAYQSEQVLHRAPALFSDFMVEAGRDTLENWQSEFLQLIWQVAGLAYLLHVGSPASREGSERLERKVDAILRAVDKEAGAKIIDLDTRYDRTD